MALSSHWSEVCNRLVFEAVNENSVFKLQLAIDTYGPIELLTSLAQPNKECETPLAVAMKRKYLSIIDKLVIWISKFYVYKKKDCKQMLTDIIDLLSHHIPIMELIDYLIGDLTDEDWLEFIAQVFIKSTSFTRHDRIIALELIGASLIISSYYSSFVKGFSALKYWKEAMTLRYLLQDGELVLHKTPYGCLPTQASTVVFDSAIEVMSVEELNLLKENYKRNGFSSNSVVRFLCIKRLKIQALLVIRRISSQAIFGHPHWLYLECLRKFGEYLMYIQENLGSSEDSKIVINICLLILEQTNGSDPKLVSRKKCDVFIQSLGLWTICFSKMLQAQPGSPERQELSYTNLLAPVKFIAAIQCDHLNSNDRLRISEIVFHFLFVLDSISPQMTSEEKQKLEENYSNYIRNFFPKRTSTVLHAAVRGGCRGRFSLNSHLGIIKLILKLGGDPNAIDENGRTPLHILAGVKSLHLDANLLVLEILVNAGGHLDTAADNGETVVNILKRNLMEYYRRSLILQPYLESLINTVFPLSCYAARVIRRNGIRFDGDRLPLHLQEFVQRHSTKDYVDCSRTDRLSPFRLRFLGRDKK